MSESLSAEGLVELFKELSADEDQLFEAKNKGYTKGGDPFGNFKRRAVILGLYPGLDLSKPEVVALVDKTKQMDAAMWMMSQGYEDSIEPSDKRWRDDSVYGKIIRLLRKAQSIGR